ncbi:UNVERIFIED_CONTAM: hypothetical protein PYX00_002636 [Menopon gallinae]|uniref:PID domain-containing protein n=1 Tax=Menopon gallinae TaxID=328185 RepID=A0AAW2HYN8_9NEOP
MSFLKSFWKGNTKHKKLYDEAALGNGICDVEPLGPSAEEFKFRVKYLGSTLVEKPSSKEATAEAVKTVISMAKAGGRKPRRVELRVNLHGVKMVDVPAEDTRLEVSIYRISYCSADAAHGQVFAFIATNANETMECHVFSCPKRKTAQIMSLTLARLFRMAYDLWAETLTEDGFILPPERKGADFRCEDPAKDGLVGAKRTDSVSSDFGGESNARFGDRTLLVDLDGDDFRRRGLRNWEIFEEESVDHLNYAR